jgi:hypothetical protein
MPIRKTIPTSDYDVRNLARNKTEEQVEENIFFSVDLK